MLKNFKFENLMFFTSGVLLKIDFGLPIFGCIASSNIKSIQPPYHAAARRSIYAFPTSPTKCILSETGLPSITNRIKESTTRLIPKLYTTPNRLLADDFKNIFKERRRYKCPSTLRICANFSRKNGDFVVCTDSLSTLLTINNPEYRDPTIR
nr:uncharacterized protein LOC118877089 [Drosophila suzukii]